MRRTVNMHEFDDDEDQSRYLDFLNEHIEGDFEGNHLTSMDFEMVDSFGHALRVDTPKIDILTTLTRGGNHAVTLTMGDGETSFVQFTDLKDLQRAIMLALALALGFDPDTEDEEKSSPPFSGPFTRRQIGDLCDMASRRGRAELNDGEGNRISIMSKYAAEPMSWRAVCEMAATEHNRAKTAICDSNGPSTMSDKIQAFFGVEEQDIFGDFK